jgi:hypothetical protein
LNITIENNRVVVNLDNEEFPKFQTMFANLQTMKTVTVEFREFPGGNSKCKYPILPMHLCRTIGEANLSEDPFATVSLYPFWKHGFAFGAGGILALNPQVDDPHKISSFSDEVAMGICVWSAEEIFKCVEWADTSALIKAGAVFPIGLKRPDIICTFPDNSLGIFEAKGTTGGSIAGALAEGKIQTAGITAPVQIKFRVVVGTLIGEPTKIILLDPPGDDDSVRARHAVPLPTNLTPEMVAKAAKAMRTVPSVIPATSSVIPAKAGIQAGGGETIFRSALGEIKLTTEMKPEKKHTWLDVK